MPDSGRVTEPGFGVILNWISFTHSRIAGYEIQIADERRRPRGVPVDSYRSVTCLIGPGERGKRDEETGNDGDGCKNNLHKSSFSPC